MQLKPQIIPCSMHSLFEYRHVFIGTIYPLHFCFQIYPFHSVKLPCLSSYFGPNLLWATHRTLLTQHHLADLNSCVNKKTKTDALPHHTTLSSHSLCLGWTHENETQQNHTGNMKGDCHCRDLVFVFPTAVKETHSRMPKTKEVCLENHCLKKVL